MAKNELAQLLHYEDIRHNQSVNIITGINSLPISLEWKDIFAYICTGRTWYRLSKTQQSKMINIAEIDSSAIKYLAKEHRKKAGLTLMEKISVEISTEEDRQKAMLAILEKGAKEARRDIDLLIAQSKS